jgi:xanthine dehydrogenase accessory factor
MRANTWHEALHNCHTQGLSYVLITAIVSAGSTPRENGCKMVVTGEAQYDTIGGGHLEFDAIKTAREYLLQGKQSQHIVSYPLSSKLGQCCGGAVKLLFEVYVNHQQHIAIFGAGHVASALVPILAQLPLQISWIDSRQQLFDEQTLTFPANVKCIVNDDPVDEISRFTEHTWVLILTHNHQLDYTLAEAFLKQGKTGFLGMIGSQTKAKRFQTRLQHRGFTPKQIEQLDSPIGDTSIPGKLPIEVAISISAQIIKKLHANAQPDALALTKSSEDTVL